jgi:hypothetical protein
VSGYSVDDDGAGVMAFNGTKRRTVPLPPLPSSLIYTGSGNIAAASPKSVWLEIEPTTPGYRAIGQVALSWIPGTRSLWAAAVEYNVKSPKSNPQLLILTYGG